ncbi:MAG: hypothetical protein JWP65_3006 [Ramlibacter sp.]|nr:hypothetical protein [Ramlibacter sp.]
MHTLHVGTRKGLFTVRRQATGWRLGEPAFAGGPVTQVLADPADGAWYAALRLGHFGVKLQRSTDGGGGSWQEVAAPALPPKPQDGPWKDDATPWSVDLVWCLQAGAGRLWAGCLPAGLFHSDDAGRSWHLATSLVGAAGTARVVRWRLRPCRHPLGAGRSARSAAPDDRRFLRRCLANARRWHHLGQHLARAGRRCLHAAAAAPRRQHPGRAPHRRLRGAADVRWLQHHGGMYRSVEGGALWTPITAAVASSFGVAVAAHPREPLRAWFAPANSDARRMPVNGRLVVTETRDGEESFTARGDGLPARDVYHLVYRHGLDSTADGEVLALALGSTTGGLWISEDGGSRWECVSRGLPPIAVLRFA